MYINRIVLCAHTSTIYFHLGASNLSMLKQNKGRPGIYKWTHIESGKSYVGSPVDFFFFMHSYYMLGSKIILIKRNINATLTFFSAFFLLNR